MVINTTDKVIYLGNGVTKEFPYSFTIDDKENIKILLVNLQGKEILLVEDYFVDTVKQVVAYPGYPPGQEPIESDRPPILPDGWKMIIYRQVPVTQETDFGDKWPFYIIEKAFDKLTMLIQQSLSLLDRSIVFPISENFQGKLPAPIISNASLAINSTGDGLRYGPNPDDAGTALLVAGEAKEIAIDAKNIAQNAATRVEEQIVHIDQQVVEATKQADKAEQQANLAELYAQAAAIDAELYNPAKVYNPPDMVVVGSETYRCIETSVGEYPPDSNKWLVLAVVGYDTFKVNNKGDLLQLANPKPSSLWRINDEGDIMAI